MPNFSQISKDRLFTCDPQLITLFGRVIQVVDCTIICGHRNEEDQNKAFAEGKSQKRWPDSEHNTFPSKAVDAAPYYPGTKIRWNDAKGFIHFAGVVRGIAAELGINIRWGGDWDGDFDLLDQRFNDLPHFEILP